MKWSVKNAIKNNHISKFLLEENKFKRKKDNKFPTGKEEVKKKTKHVILEVQKKHKVKIFS